ncbi:3090_t:CDS:2 [Funneliformis mosseae]|uniref:3090_t:CDS:1 n=1 Tax=Funneliformis mosseae TaxID=27381 RepID=A0A9N9DDR4_FUNMO|nr:3090_t:CDS:2 [Funneliformis mosseae]
MAERTKITLNCVVKENPIEGQFRIKIDENDFICDLRKAIRENQRGTFEYGSLSIKLWLVDIDLGNRAVLEQLQNADSNIKSVTGGIRIIEGFRKIGLHFNNPDPNKIHLVVQGCERKAKNPPSDPGSDVEGFHDYDEGNEDNSISLTSNDIIAFNKEIENLGPGDEDSDVGYDTP